MNIRFIVLLTSLFLYFTLIQIPISASANYAEGLIIKSKPSTQNSKRLRLTDTLIDKAWKGEKGKNVLKIDLGEERKFNTVRFQVKEDITFTEIKLKAGTSNDNKVVIYDNTNLSRLANEWITLKTSKTNARYINLILKKKRPKIYELEVYCTEQDFNGDGYDDFIVGAYLHNAGGSDRGRAYVYLGGSSLSSTPALTLSGDEDGALFGNSVTGIGDINKDGYDDFIVGAYLHNAGGSNRGRAYVYLGGSSLGSTPALTLSGDQDGALFGNSVNDIDDVNNDGYDDFIVGAYSHNAGGTSQGRAYVYLGGSSLSSSPALTLSGDENSALFGNSVSGIGDANKDGYDDFIVTAPFHDAGAGSTADRGRAYVYLGGFSLSSTPALILSGDEDDAFFGNSVSGIGDANKDGYSDFIVCADGHDAGAGSTANRGRAYVYFGGSSLSSIPSVLTGDEDGAIFGNSVSGIGDANKDGYDDFIVAAYGHDAEAGSSADRGRAYVYFGGSSLSSTPALTLSGDENSALFGNSVSGIGDANKDGYDDFIVTAPFHDAGAGSNADRGRAYVYFGGTNLSSTPSVLSGDEDIAYFGISVD